jgi:hypothetical protein
MHQHFFKEKLNPTFFSDPTLAVGGNRQDRLSSCPSDLSAISHQYFSLRINQPQPCFLALLSRPSFIAIGVHVGLCYEAYRWIKYLQLKLREGDCLERLSYASYLGFLSGRQRGMDSEWPYLQKLYSLLRQSLSLLSVVFTSEMLSTNFFKKSWTDILKKSNEHFKKLSHTFL